LDLERERAERKANNADKNAFKRNIRMLQQEIHDDDLDSGAELLSSEDEVELEDEGMYQLACEVKQQKQRFYNAGRPVDTGVVNRRAVRKYNQRFFPNQRAQYQAPQQPQRRGQIGLPLPKRETPLGARQAVGLGGAAAGAGNAPYVNAPYRVPGPPNKMEPNKGVQKTTFELLAMANCQRGQCIQCGQQGHYMLNAACALKDKPLMDRPCIKCGQGLHQADDCLQIFQRYVAQQQPQQQQAPNQQVNLLQNEPLNGE